MTAEVPEIKLVKVLTIALTENTLMTRYCVGQTFIVYGRKEIPLQRKSY